MAKAHKPTNNEKVVARIVALLQLEITLVVLAFRGYYTIGRYTPAVGPKGYVVYGYGGIDPKFGEPAREYTGPSALEQAAWAIVNSCGSTRAGVGIQGVRPPHALTGSTDPTGVSRHRAYRPHLLDPILARTLLDTDLRSSRG